MAESIGTLEMYIRDGSNLTSFTLHSTLLLSNTPPMLDYTCSLENAKTDVPNCIHALTRLCHPELCTKDDVTHVQQEQCHKGACKAHLLCFRESVEEARDVDGGAAQLWSFCDSFAMALVYCSMWVGGIGCQNITSVDESLKIFEYQISSISRVV